MLDALLSESTNSICYKITVKILPVSHVTRKQYCLNAFSVLSTEEGFFWGVHPRSPRSTAVTKQLQHGVTVSPGPSAHTQGSPKAEGPAECLPQPGAVLSQGVQDGVGDVTAARGTQGLQLVAPSAYRDEPVVCDLLRERQGQHHRP